MFGKLWTDTKGLLIGKAEEFEFYLVNQGKTVGIFEHSGPWNNLWLCLENFVPAALQWRDYRITLQSLGLVRGWWAGKGSWHTRKARTEVGQFPLHFLHVLLDHQNFTQVLRNLQRLQNFFFNKTELRWIPLKVLIVGSIQNWHWSWSLGTWSPQVISCMTLAK